MPSDVANIYFDSITQSSGMDIVRINAFIRDYNVCKAVESVTGTNDISPCEPAFAGLGLAIFIKFN